MHSTELYYDDYDTRYTNIEAITEHPDAKVVVNFHYNSDLSGEVKIIINQAWPDEYNFTQLGEIQIPGWMLCEFVGRHMQGDAISAIEDMSGRSFLDLLVPSED